MSSVVFENWGKYAKNFVKLLCVCQGMHLTANCLRLKFSSQKTPKAGHKAVHVKNLFHEPLHQGEQDLKKIKLC